jgi:hypothetical protein
MSVIPSGSSPETGSSRTRIRGTWTHAARKLHPLLVPVGQGSDPLIGLDAYPGPPQPPVTRPRSVTGGQTVRPGQVGPVIVRAHLRVQAPLLGHVAERQPIGAREQPAAPADRALVRQVNAHHDPHGRCLSRPAAAEEPEDPPGFDGERQAVQGDHPPVPPAQPGQLERA